ncbi:MAG: transcription antitermination factor NusB [Lachnospiraceae bacterium]
MGCRRKALTGYPAVLQRYKPDAPLFAAGVFDTRGTGRRGRLKLLPFLQAQAAGTTVGKMDDMEERMGRRELRENIFKLLFMTEFNAAEDLGQQNSLYFEDIQDLKEKDRVYMQEKLERIREKLPEIDEKLNTVSKGWKTSRMGKVDLSILRLAVYEILFDEDVPTGVAINEAVELAKKFGGDDTPSFVNGLLGRMVKADE